MPMTNRSRQKMNSIAEDGSGGNETKKININEVSLQDLAAMPLMSEQRARLIVDHRNANGQFARIEDLESVTGIGGALAAMLKQHFFASESSPNESTTTTTATKK